MTSPAEKAVASFTQHYGSAPDIVALAPGRVNLIGEHTDYTGGFVLPVAIDRAIAVAASRRDDNVIEGYSLDFDETASTTAGSYDPSHPNGWFRYVMGVLSELGKVGRNVEGFNFTVGGDVPIGSGLSSSAAIEMAVLTAMEGLYGFHMENVDAALLCQSAENKFVGMNCGIMDQYISRTGRANHAVLIDCDDLSYKTIPLNVSGHSWLVIDSRKKRGLVDSEYNNRRRECEEGVTCAQQAFPDREIAGLRDITTADLDHMTATCPEVVLKRVKHVVSENERVLKTVDALSSGDIGAVGEDLYGSHSSLRDDFEVSCAELDSIVDILSGIDGVAGARLTGAGFGGCVIALVRDDAIARVTDAVQSGYRPDFLKGESADIWPVTVSDGAHIVDKSK